MIDVNKFVYDNNLLPADAIVLRKKFLGMVDHYAIYLGENENGEHKFSANFTKGVRELRKEEIQKELTTYLPEKIERCPTDRNQALNRAFAMIGEKAYNYLSNNCEHYKNLVHYGVKKSAQVESAGKTLLVGGGVQTIYGLSKSKNKFPSVVKGVGMLLLGLVLVGLSTNEEEK